MFVLKLVTPSKKILDGQEIEEVFVPGYSGEINVLPGHAPLVTTLQTGVLKYRLKGRTELNHVAVSWGYCEVNPFGVTILADTAEGPQDVQVDRAREAKRTAESQIDGGQLTVEEFQKVNRKLRRAEVRLEVAQSKH